MGQVRLKLEAVVLTTGVGLSSKAPPEQYQPAAQSPVGSDRPSPAQYRPAGGQRSGMNTCVRSEVCARSEVLPSWWTEGRYEHLCEE